MSSNGNAALYFVDRHVDEGRGGKVAFREAAGEKRTLTYGTLSKRSACVVDALKRAGIRREDRALMLVLDKIEFPEIFWGCLKAGVVPIPLNTLLATDVYRSILNDSRAACLFLSEELLPVVGPAIADAEFLRHVVVVGTKTPDGAQSYTDFLAGCAPEKPVAVSDDETAFWLYSSGSTGLPKGVRHVHSSLKASSDTYGKQVLNIREDDVVYSVAKIFFAYGLGNAMSFPMSVGATTILYDARPTSAVVMGIISVEKPTVFCGVPTLYAAILAHMESENHKPPTKLRRCISAGEALPEDIGKAWAALWGVDILDGVGSTEMLHIFLSNSPNDVVYGTSGIAVPGYDLRLVDDTGKDISGPDEIGELLVRGASGADGYWNQRDKSRATFEGEWTRTGDKYELSHTGRFIYCGRSDDLFKVSGIWVSPFEVEQALGSHPDVLEAAVVAARDDQGLEKPKAFVVLKSWRDCDTVKTELKEHVKDKVGKWKYPRWIEIVPDLPKTATGKIQRFKLRSNDDV